MSRTRAAAGQAASMLPAQRDLFARLRQCGVFDQDDRQLVRRKPKRDLTIVPTPRSRAFSAWRGFDEVDDATGHIFALVLLDEVAGVVVGVMRLPGSTGNPISHQALDAVAAHALVAPAEEREHGTVERV